jgi:hypothetical protein
MTKFYIDQIEELAAESVKAASLTPLQADESAPLSRRDAVRGEAGERLAPHRPSCRRYRQAIYVVAAGKIPICGVVHFSAARGRPVATGNDGYPATP